MIHVQEEFAGYGPGKLGLTTVPSRFVNSFLLSQEAVGVPKRRKVIKELNE